MSIKMDVKPFFLRLPQVMNLVGLGRSSIFKAVKEGTFPAPVNIAKRAIAWRYSDIKKWVDERPTARDI